MSKLKLGGIFKLPGKKLLNFAFRPGDTAPPGAPSRFTELIDCPADYIGHAGKMPLVNTAEDALEFCAKTSYLSISGVAFHGISPDINEVIHDNPVFGIKVPTGKPTIETYAPVFLPHGAVITSVIVYGDDTSATWGLWKNTSDGVSGTRIATENINTADTTISSPIVDNSGYTYNFLCYIEEPHYVSSARITYTTN